MIRVRNYVARGGWLGWLAGLGWAGWAGWLLTGLSILLWLRPRSRGAWLARPRSLVRNRSLKTQNMKILDPHVSSLAKNSKNTRS